jgi:Neutral/alkaline non-lysosomal ceramidase, N-terminal
VRIGLRSILLLCGVLAVSGCATSDYHETSYCRKTIQNLSANSSKLSATEPSTLHASAKRVEITPPVGMPLQGYGSRHGHPSRGVRDPLYARVLVLKNDTTRLILVGCDLMAVTENLYEAIFAKVHAKTPIRRSELILFATHTHSGAGGLSNRFVMELVGGKFRHSFFNKTTDKITSAIIESLQDTQPALFGIGSTTIDDLNKNRAWEKGAVDRELGVLRVTTKDGQPLAWLVNFAAHPTTLGVNWEFSGDFPGELAREAEKHGSVMLFANGAAGDLKIQRLDDESKESTSERAGSLLAAKVKDLSPKLSGTETAQLNTERIEMILPPVRIRVGSNPHVAIPSFIGTCFFPRRVPVEVARVNHALLLAVPAELCAETGLEFKETASKLGYQLFVIGYANDYVGYVVPERYYTTKEYEARTSFYGPKLDPYMREVVTKMIRDISK